jgi:hypothetical protein
VIAAADTDIALQLLMDDLPEGVVFPTETPSPTETPTPEATVTGTPEATPTP